MIARLWRWLTGSPSDDPIDRLIADKGVQRYRPGMGTWDASKTDRWGARRWQEVLRAERRQQKADVREFPRRASGE